MKKLVLIILFTAFFSSCKKYPEGAAYSLLTKITRLANSWRVDSYFENGTDKTTDFNAIFQGYFLSTNKNGNYSLFYKLYGTLDWIESGVWKFSSDKKKVNLVATGSGNLSTWRILKLKNTELWVIDESDNLIVKEYHFIQS